MEQGHVRRTVEIDDRPYDHGRDCRRRCEGRVAGAVRGQHGEVPTCRSPHDADPLGVHVILGGAGGDPSERRLDVADLFAPANRRRHPVFHVEDFVPEPVEPPVPLGRRAPIAVFPPATMHHENRGAERPRIRLPGRPHVQLEFRPVGRGAVYHRPLAHRSAYVATRGVGDVVAQGKRHAQAPGVPPIRHGGDQRHPGTEDTRKRKEERRGPGTQSPRHESQCRGNQGQRQDVQGKEEHQRAQEAEPAPHRKDHAPCQRGREHREETGHDVQESGHELHRGCFRAEPT